MTRYTLAQRPDPTRRTRKTVELTAAQNAALEQLITHAEQTARDATGLHVTISVRQFFHMLLKKHAQESGLDWPDDYPAHGGRR